MFIVIFLLATIAPHQSEVLANTAVVRTSLSSLATRAKFDNVSHKIGEIIAHESKAKPYSDSGIVNILSQHGVHILTRSVEWHRKSLGIDAHHTRKMDYISDAIREVITSEDPIHPLLDKEIAYALQEHGFELSEHNVWAYRLILGILSAQERQQENMPEAQDPRVLEIKIAIREIIAAESAPLTDAKIVTELNQRGIKISGSTVQVYRIEMGIPSSRKRIAEIPETPEKTAIQAIVAAEIIPLTDEQIAAALNQQGIEISTSTVRRYRTKLGIPSYWQRVQVEKPVKTIIQAIVAAEIIPLTDEQIAAELKKRGIEISHVTVHKHRTKLGIPSSWKRGRIETQEKTAIQAIVANEDTPLTDEQIATELNQQGIKISKSTVRRHRVKMGISSSRRRGIEKR